MSVEQGTVVEHRLDAEGVDPLLLAGVNDAHIQEVTGLFDVRFVLRGDHVILSGELAAVESAVPLVQHLIELSRLRVPFDTNDIARFGEGFGGGGRRAPGKQCGGRSAGVAQSDPPEVRRTASIPQVGHGVRRGDRDRASGDGKDLFSRGRGPRRSLQEAGPAHCSGSARGGGWRESGLSSWRHAGEGRSVSAPTL